MAIRIPRPFDRKRKQPDENQDIGFEETLTGGTAELINADGTFNIERYGGKNWNTYKYLIKMQWWKFFLFLFLGYIFINVVFAFLYMVEGSTGTYGMIPGSFFDELLQSFFLSVETFTTVGYGHMSPIGIWSRSISVLNSFTGLMSFALATGLFFAKFSMPENPIVFSKKIIIAPFEDGRALMMRVVNSTDHRIVDLSATVTITWMVMEGDKYRRKFSNLDLKLDNIRLFPLNWTLVHPINEKSPLYGKDMNELVEANTEILVMIKGHDVTYGKSIHIARSYDCKELINGAIFVPMYDTGNEITKLHLDRIDEIEDYYFPD
jgi:inward rectifier potassium channel